MKTPQDGGCVSQAGMGRQGRDEGDHKRAHGGGFFLLSSALAGKSERSSRAGGWRAPPGGSFSFSCPPEVWDRPRRVCGEQEQGRRAQAALVTQGIPTAT